MHSQSQRVVSFILVCNDLDRAGWVVLNAIRGIDAIGKPVDIVTIQENLSLPPQLISVVSDVDISNEYPEAARFLLPTLVQ